MTPAEPTHVLIVTDDVLTERMAGPAIRAWEIAGLLSADHAVVLATTSPVCETHSERFTTEAADAARFVELEAWCDVVLVQGYVLERVPAVRDTSKVMIVDLYDPIFLEDLELNRSLPEPERTRQIVDAVRVFGVQAARGDFFLCASEKQRDLWMGFLAASGRVNPATYARDPSLRSLLDVVSFGLPDDPPHHDGPALRGVTDGIGSDDDIVLWGGGVYDWLDPVTAIRAIDRVRSSRPNVRLFFLGVKHPSPFAQESRALLAARATAAELGLTGTHVFFNDGWIPYARRADYLLEADIGISLHTDHVETAYSFRTRILDCIWAGLPIVATGGDAFAELIDREGLGTIVPPEDAAAVADAVVELLEDRHRRERVPCQGRHGGPTVRLVGGARTAHPVLRGTDPCARQSARRSGCSRERVGAHKSTRRPRRVSGRRLPAGRAGSPCLGHLPGGGHPRRGEPVAPRCSVASEPLFTRNWLLLLAHACPSPRHSNEHRDARGRRGVLRVGAQQGAGHRRSVALPRAAQNRTPVGSRRGGGDGRLARVRHRAADSPC